MNIQKFVKPYKSQSWSNLNDWGSTLLIKIRGVICYHVGIWTSKREGEKQNTWGKA